MSAKGHKQTLLATPDHVRFAPRGGHGRDVAGRQRVRGGCEPFVRNHPMSNFPIFRTRVTARPSRPGYSLAAPRAVGRHWCVARSRADDLTKSWALDILH
jgi:hypothetical protein